MPKCPNCGQRGLRTEDWACQWCGYPLLSESYKKIPKTYKELKEERGYKEGPLAEEEIEPTAMLEPEAVAEVEAEPVAGPEAEVEAEPIAGPEAESAAEVEAEPVVGPEAEPEAKPAAKARAKPAAKARAKPAARAKAKPAARAKAKPAAKAKASEEPEVEAEAEPEAEPAVKTEPVTVAMELTVDELLSAYEEDGAAADAKFANKIIRVTGVADRIEIKDFLDIHYITLTSTKTSLLQGVRCSFAKTHGEELSQLTAGQTVVVQGKYDGSLIDISMRDCVLV